MTLTLDGPAKMPQYLRLADELRRQIASGQLRPGDRLPTYTAVRQQHGINAYTMERAQALLEQEGLISRERGRGAFVAQPRAKVLTGLIGCCGVDFTSTQYSPYWASLMEGVEAAAGEAGMRLLLLGRESTVGWDKVDGVLINGMWVTLSENALPAGMPAVSLMAPIWPNALYHRALDRQRRTPPGRLPQISLAPGVEARRRSTVSSVGTDDYAGMLAATRHQLELGHRRIAYLTNSDSDPILYPQRFSGYRDALRDYGIEIEPAWVRRLPTPSPEVYFMTAGRAAMGQWLREGWRELGCTALMAHNDEVAWGAADAMHEAGWSIPGDVSIVGFDGTLAAQWCRPSLTTVAVPLAAIGRAAVEMLLQQMNGDAGAIEHRVLPPALEVRASTAPPR